MALVQSGFPPVGRGIYVRSSISNIGNWAQFHAVLAWQVNAQAFAQQLGAGWLFGGLEHWRPETWRESLTYIVDRANRWGVPGIIVDPEEGWAGLTGQQRERELTLFGEALSATAENLRVGITSFPNLPGLATLASRAGSKVWGSPQIYNRTSQSAQDFARWYGVWRDLFAGRVIPSFAAWDSGRLGTEALYREYLAKLPNAQGAIGWPAGSVPAHMKKVLSSWEPGGSLVGTVAMAAGAWIARPAGVATIAAAVIILTAIAMAVRVTK